MTQDNIRFALTGAAGYVAPRHMEAIKHNNCDLVTILDPNDSVGQIDNFFPDCLYFNNFERFERYINRRQLSDSPLHYLSICSPNYLHDTHCRFALMNGMHAICEKPLVLNPWNLDILQETEEKTGFSIYNILQLRLHPEVIKLKKYVDSHPDKHFDINLTYITSRGPWYHISWKGQEEKSGGIASNIGIHFFDMLMWIFGKCQKSEVYAHNENHAAGSLVLEKANVNWFLSVDAQHLDKVSKSGQRTYRALNIDGEDFEFSTGFDDLHILSYEKILNHKGFTTQDVRDSIELVHKIRNAEISDSKQSTFINSVLNIKNNNHSE